METEKIAVGDVFTFIGDEDQAEEIEVLGMLTIEGNDYVAVAFVEDLAQETDEEIDLFFLRVEEGSELTEIESDEEFDIVSKAFEGVDLNQA